MASISDKDKIANDDTGKSSETEVSLHQTNKFTWNFRWNIYEMRKKKLKFVSGANECAVERITYANQCET